MATARKIEILTVSLDARPGSLAAVYAAFREAKVNAIWSWAYQMGPDMAQGHFYASDTKKAKAALEKIGKTPKLENACYYEDADELGRYHDVLKKIAAAGLNIEASDAFGLGGKFATVFFAAAADIPKLCSVLGCK